jgi:hypothetical protein
MERVSLVSMLLAIGLLGFAQMLRAQPQTLEQKLKSAMSAGPPSIAEHATILDSADVAKAKVLRHGTNGWTCLPDDPGSPGNDPQCLDSNGLEWWKALMAHTAPKLTAVGIDYGLQGGSDASNTDPFASQPPAGQQWVNSPPHVMFIPGPGQKLDPAIFSTDPHSGGPWIMFPGTPYAHLMVPVK